MPNPKNPADPKTVEEREGIANDCIRSMKLTIPFLIDNMDDTANQGYSAWPDRIYVVGKDGKVAYKGSQGPRGFKPDEAKAKLKELLAP